MLLPATDDKPGMAWKNNGTTSPDGDTDTTAAALFYRCVIVIVMACGVLLNA